MKDKVGREQNVSGAAFCSPTNLPSPAVHLEHWQNPFDYTHTLDSSENELIKNQNKYMLVCRFMDG